MSGASNFKQYIRNRQRDKVGIMVAFLDGNEVKVGWSVCCKGDVFDKINVRVAKTGGEILLTHDAKYALSVSDLPKRVLDKADKVALDVFYIKLPNDGEGERLAADSALSGEEKFIPVKYDEQIAYFANRVIRYFGKNEELIIPNWVYSMNEVWIMEYEYEFKFQRELKKIRKKVEEAAEALFLEEYKKLVGRKHE
jgi:hypothetical protein